MTKFPEQIPEPKKKSNPQPRALQILMSMAIEQLNAQQKEIWFCHNNERLTQDEIAERLNLKRTTVETMIQRIEKKLEKYIRNNMASYLLLKMEQVIMEDDL